MKALVSPPKKINREPKKYLCSTAEAIPMMLGEEELGNKKKKRAVCPQNQQLASKQRGVRGAEENGGEVGETFAALLRRQSRLLSRRAWRTQPLMGCIYAGVIPTEIKTLFFNKRQHHT